MSAPIPAESFVADDSATARIAILERKLARERQARLEAEAIAERGLRELYIQRSHVELLNRIADAANDSNEPESLLRFAIAEICEATEWPVANVLLCNNSGGDTRLEGSGINFSLNPDQCFGLLEASRQIIAWPCATTPGCLLIDPTPMWTTNVINLPGFARAGEMAALGLTSTIASPVLMGHELVAVIEFFLREGSEPSEDMCDLLVQIGQQLGRVFKRRRNHDQLLRSTLNDLLTGLPNRTQFNTRMRDIFVRRHTRNEPGPSLIYIDLDGFKLVNDTLGHKAGDQLLLALSSRLSKLVDEFSAAESALYDDPGEIFLARISGDEFSILIDAPDREALALEMAEAIHAALKQPHRFEGSDVVAAASIGIAHDDGHYESPEELLRDADVAMYEAKINGPDRTIVFDQNLRATALRQLQLEADLRQAIEAKEFSLVYQPIVSLPEQTIVGFEALIRWQRANGEIIAPDEFIPAAEKSGLILVIGLWVFREACRAAVRWRQQLPPDRDMPYVSVNVAASQFLQPNFLGHIEAILAETGADPAWIAIEATESAAILNPVQTARTLQALRDRKFRICLDDFGTGYSSLSHLQTMPIDIIKIDRSFVMNQTEDDPRWSIVNAVMQLAKAMNLSVVAEGIESAFQSDHLITIGCDYGQGFHFARPMQEPGVLSLIGRPLLH